MIRARTRTNPPYCQKDIQDPDSAYRTTKRRMKHNANERRIMAEKIILLPIACPRQIEEQRAHLERKDHHKRAINPIHWAQESRPVRKGSGAANRLLRRLDSFGHATVV